LGTEDSNSNDRPARRIQMADIARLAGVSAPTVSRVLSGNRSVNEGTRQKVLELARSLNYTVNAGAKELRLGRSNTVSVVIPYAKETRQTLGDPFFLGILGSIAEVLTERGYEMLFSRVDASDLKSASLSFDSGRAMGLILIGQWLRHGHLNELADRGVRMVVWGARMEDQRYLTVGGDNVEGGRVATAHLLDRGRRRIAFIGDTALPEVAHRYRGYRAALAAAGLPLDEALVWQASFLPASGREFVERALAADVSFDAIFACSDVLAMAAIAVLRAQGRRVPEDVAVVGYDDVAFASLFQPQLTTVRQPLEEGGRALVETLLAQLEGRPAGSRVLPTELVIRESA
jgi:DNA-binding LacI/PurR family transcriptional regulator